MLYLVYQDKELFIASCDHTNLNFVKADDLFSPPKSLGGLLICLLLQTNFIPKLSLSQIIDNPLDILKVLGNNIKLYRTQLNLTQEELASLSGVYRTHLAGIETGHLNPSVKTVEKLAKALNVTVADLFRDNAE